MDTFDNPFHKLETTLFKTRSMLDPMEINFLQKTWEIFCFEDFSQNYVLKTRKVIFLEILLKHCLFGRMCSLVGMCCEYD